MGGTCSPTVNKVTRVQPVLGPSLLGSLQGLGAQPAFSLGGRVDRT